MQNLILTHNTMVYAIASLTNLTLGSFFVCSHIYEKWLKRLNYSLMDVNALIKGIIVLLGSVVISPWNLLSGNFFIECSSLFLGCIIGYLFFKFEILAIRKFPYQQKFNVSVGSNLNKTKLNSIKNRLRNKSDIIFPQKNHYSYFSTGIVAIFEELLFRGFLTMLCIRFPDLNVSIICILLVNFIFALSHINLGYLHVITKFILGLTCLISFLLLESIVISIIIHTTFNLLAVKKLRVLQDV